ncbi:hypothetical protein O0L34_g7516 [Tuta absoluta]|nr:hypothetical protein O0L34_g7516 [Tuta absoluta]
MVGRAYTMKEQKQIVDYLVEYKVYNEIRGRKMWMDLACTKILDRSWQSLKETFLKRILPDIHNPYYKLTVQQIASFRQERDMNTTNTNKLEFTTISDSSSTDRQRAKEPADKRQDEQTGEDKCSKIQNRTRSSTETLVLETCDENAEDIQKDFEHPNDNKQLQKSLRDFITYSEPLTPMLQEVLHDFSSDDDPPMQIVEEPEALSADGKNCNKSKSPETIRESQSYNKQTEAVDNGDEQGQKTQTSKIKSLKLKKTRKGTWENKEPVGDVASTLQDKETNNNEADTICDTQENTNSPKINVVVSVKNNSNSTTDTQLPNNQEELGDKPKANRKSTESSNSDFLEPRKKKKDKSRKRTHSQSSVERKKKKKDNNREPSETREQDNTETFNSHPQAAIIQNVLLNGTEMNKDISNNKSELTNDTDIPPNVVVEDTTGRGIEGTSQEAGPSVVNPGDINPCLKSVSLYEEQFSQSKISDYEDEIALQDKETPNKKDIQIPKENHEKEIIEDNHVKDTSKESDAVSNILKDSAAHTDAIDATTSKIIDDVVLLRSRSESSEHFDVPKKIAPVSRVNKSRETALANVFGFASGGVHKRPLNHRKSSSRRFSHRHRINSRTFNVDSGSSDEYTTASDSDDSLPTHSRSTHRKYVKPPSFDFLSHENGLFVVGRKKIYPLCLRENGALHYACSTEGIDAEQADSYWKTKYFEEKIRADELARLLGKAQEAEETKQPKSPILQANQSLTTLVNKNQPTKAKEAATERESKPEEKVRIKFNRNKDIELEGQWTNINPILERMVEIFKNNDSQSASNSKQEPNPKIEEKVVTEEKPVAEQKENARNENAKVKNKRSLSRKTNVKEKPIQIKDSDEKSSSDKTETVSLSSSSTSVDPEVHKKVDKLESEIFEKIADIEKTDQSIKEITPEASESNITKRKRGRPKKIIAAAIQEKTRSAVSLDTAPKRRLSSVENLTKTSRAQSVPRHVPKKPRTVSEGPGKMANPTSDSEAAISKRATRAPRKFGEDTVTPSPKASKATPPSEKVSIPEDDHVRYMFPPKRSPKKQKPDRPRSTAELNSPSSRPSTDYQDSDLTSPNINITRRKRKLSTASLVCKRGSIKKVKRKSCPYLADDDTCSTNESQSQKSDTIPNVSQSINSEVYKSDSYQMLMPKAKQLSHLDKIDENTVANDTEANKTNMHTQFTITNEFYIPPEIVNASRQKGSDANSSNISLPLSPEISIVENLSVSKDLISSSLERPPTINETHINSEMSPTSNKYLISGVDVSMPLMEQDCGFQTRHKNPPNRRTTFSESFFLEQAQYSSESLDIRLRDLLLESAKKISQGSEPTNMEVDTVPSEKKAKVSKRRSSTPCKKKTVLRSKTPEVDPVIEEHTESCSHSGRQSCPPVIQIIPCEIADNNNIETDITDNNNITKKNPVRGRKTKKDVIKVKILRPRSKSCSKDVTSSRISVLTDSGINDTEVDASDECPCYDISTELIHNHSDTCLHIDECVGDSLEIVDNPTPSIISLNSNSIPSEIHIGIKSSQEMMSEEFVTPEMFCSDAQDATSLNTVKLAKKSPQRNSDDAATSFFTPPSGESFNSLITDDLSDDKPSPSKWYLINEQETNFTDCSQSSIGANLNKIFTSYAVPDLSTISERSKENDTKVMNTDTESSKPVSQSLFDVEF